MKFLIIRFSSFGDVTQCLSVPSAIREKYPAAEVHWVTRKDMTPLLENHPAIDKIWPYDRKTRLTGLLKLALQLRKEKFTHIYDAHNNLRSHFICWLQVGLNIKILRRSLKRWKRFLLLRFHINKFEMPFSGQRDLLEPLAGWGISKILPATPQLFLTEKEISENFLQRIQLPARYIALAPSAAFQLKRWPKQHFIDLIKKFPDKKFILLGGPEDRFIEEIHQAQPQNTINFTGKTNLRESAIIVSKADMLIANDTGLLHVGEQLGKPCVALMGPAPFGFPSRSTTKILEKNLACRPCSKHGQGPCTHPRYQACLVDISVDEVSLIIKESLKDLSL